jgi:tetratricopeptide (TPR) repeat protein
MALEPLDQRHLQAVDGFIELGMFEEADARLEELDPILRSAFEVLIRRLAIYHGLKKWDSMQVVAQKLAEFDVQNIDWVVSYAYATHRIGSTDAARTILLNAQPRFPKEGIIYYNLACYDCQLGEIESAKNRLKKAFEIDPTWRSQALEDEDLKPLWDSLRLEVD